MPEESSGVTASLKWTRWVGVAILTIHAALLAWAATRHSPNANEPAHLAVGISHWKFGRFELYRVNPPLIRMVAALPVLLTGAETDWSNFHEAPGARPVFGIGEDFMKANGYRSFWLMTLARWACIPFSLVGGYVCYRWGRELYGNLSGLLALTLWCFSPNILAHAEFITPDAGATAMGLAAMYLFWRWLRRPGWLLTIAAGVFLGLAELTKSTWILLFALWPALWLVWCLMERRGNGRPSFLRRFGQLVLILLLGLHVLNMGYGYDGSFRKLENFQFVSQTLGAPKTSSDSPCVGNQFVGTWFGKLPVPLPEQYLMGIDVQKHDFERGHGSYFRGQWYDHGFWYYYVYALAVKVPIGTWLLALLAAFRWGGSGRCRDEFVLLAPVVVFLSFVSAETGYNAHLRYVLLIFPLAFIRISQLARVTATNSITLKSLTAAALFWSVGSSLCYYPHTLAYFNELVGGPTRGHAHLLNSNIDWGQDLLYVKKWCHRHPAARPLYLAYQTSVDPRVAKFEHLPLPRGHDSKAPCSAPRTNQVLGTQPGWYALSVSALHDRRHRYTYFREAQPVNRAGFSVYIYLVSPHEANRVRRELGMEEL